MFEPYFLKIEVQCKSISDGDWCAFLYWADRIRMKAYEIRGMQRHSEKVAKVIQELESHLH